MPVMQLVSGLFIIPNENKDTAPFVKILFHRHAALTFLFYVFQCAKTFLNLMAHISKEQTVQYILTLIDDTLQVQTDPLCSAK